MYVRGNPVMLIDPNGMSDERFGLGTRFTNWIKGDGWKNKANKHASNNGITTSTNTDGSISGTSSSTWSGSNEKGGLGGVNDHSYNYNEDGYTVTTENSKTQASYTNNYNWGGGQGGGGVDWSGIGNTLTAGGVAYYSLEKSINNSKYWVDAKGGIRSTELLERGANGKYVRGVQGLRNSQAAAANAASKYAVAGKVVGGLGMGITLMQYGTGQISGTEASIDLIMGGIGFTGWGAPISLMYFGGKFLYEYSTGNTLFEKPEGH
jgi:hypothetical protein